MGAHPEAGSPKRFPPVEYSRRNKPYKELCKIPLKMSQKTARVSILFISIIEVIFVILKIQSK